MFEAKRVSKRGRTRYGKEEERRREKGREGGKG